MELTHRRVLVVEDDPKIRELLQHALGTFFDLTQVGDAESAWLLLEAQNAFDAVVADYVLPGMSGVDLLARMRTIPRLSSIPVLVISGHGEFARVGAVSGGAEAFIAKPFVVSDLQKTLLSVIEQHSRIT
ncbi:MAG TPA: response regulator [Candidatus Baltobacteraceae bacterium]|jgi:CheY-like chemotaxis protein|nr:response regulator [Candidatus Baltobacteraceae bacterium]